MSSYSQEGFRPRARSRERERSLIWKTFFIFVPSPLFNSLRMADELLSRVSTRRRSAFERREEAAKEEEERAPKIWEEKRI